MKKWETIKKELQLKEIEERDTTEEDIAFAQQIENIGKKYFPKSGFIVKAQKGGFLPSIYGQFTLGKDESEWNNGIKENDPLLHTFHIYYEKEGAYSLKWSHGNMTSIPENKYMAYGHIKTGMRNKKTATKEQILKMMDSFFKNLKVLIKANKEKIHPNHVELFAQKRLI